MIGVLLDRARLFGLREVLVHRGRTIASMTVLAVSSSFLVAVLGLTGSLTGSISGLAESIAGDAAIEISGITDSGFAQPIRDDIARVPGVAAAVPMVRAAVPAGSGTTLLVGADASGVALHSDVQDAVLDQLPRLLSVPGGVLIGPGMGRSRGDSLPLGSGTVTVAGVLDDGTLARLNDGHFVLAPLALAQRLTGRAERLDAVLVTLAPGADPAVVRAGVTAAVAGRAVIGDPIQRVARTGNAIRIVRYMTLMGATAAFVVAAFLIYTAMSMAITQRRQAISMLRAIGGRGRSLVADLLVEAAVLGLCGGIGGAIMGIVMGRVAVRSLPNVLVQTVETRTYYVFPVLAVPIAIVIAVGTSVLASAVAAHQVYKVSPIEALAPVEVSRADLVPGWLRLGAAGQVVFCCTATAVIIASDQETLVFSAAALALFFGAGIGLCFVAAGPLVRLTARTAGIFGPPGALAAATVARAPRRVWATVMTVFMAVAITVTITGSNADMMASARGSLASVSEADAWLAAAPADQLSVGPLLPADLAAKAAAVPGVERVVPGQLAFAVLGDTKVLLDGLADGTDQPLFQGLTEPVRRDLLAGRGVVLSRDLGKSLNVGVGDSLELQTPHGVRHTPVLALVPYFSVLTGTVGIALDLMREWFDRPGATTLQIDTAPGVDTAAVLDGLRAITPAGVHLFTGAQSLAGVESALRQGSSVGTAMWIIVVLIAAVAVLNTLTLSVLERRRELGVLRALGAGRRFTLRTILAEAAGIGAIGGLLGLAFGLAGQYCYDAVTPGILNFDVAYRPAPFAVLFACGALVLSLAGAIPPALRATRIRIVDAIAVD
ncbi:ABC transporter permease [Nocardia sp. NPDC058058]|uniref:ABC transporter permease n=1 Tax=Nocardia sp. NPDC058058 TaxID=3346317 RepID=UPI0036DCE7EC